VLAHETDLTCTVDPFAGSYAVEAMTDEVQVRAEALLDRVASLGGAVAAIESGFQKAEIEASAFQTAQEIDAGDRVVVGVNRYRVAEDEPYEPLRVDPAIEAEQAGRLATLRAERDAGAVTSALADIRKAAEGTTNLLYPLREALRARATVGEVCDALRDVWGVYRPSDRL
jgi:methylmalonyl-CoA mutase N-terminal domain/subunit